MKPFSIHPGSCSCMSCVYRSRSKTLKVQEIIHGGTEIDKLYYGKFLPLRERKLLEKLIRTRDVYDDVRTQLLSSASSEQISVKHKRKRRDDVSTDHSSMVLKVVDLVDRGQMRSANKNKLSSCCTCCSCETLRKIRKRMEKDKHKHSQVHRHIVNCEDIAKYCAEAEEKGRKRRNKLSTKISSKLSSKIGGARLKMKRNLSAPCACTLSLSSMGTRSSQALRKLKSKKKKARKRAQTRKIVTIDQETKIAKFPRKPRKKVKIIQSSILEDIGSEMRGLKIFKIKKDSILLFREKLLKKRPYEENQDVECEPGTCDTDECIPEECLMKIKAKGVGGTRKRKYHTRHSETTRDKPHVAMSPRTKKVKVKDSQVQVGLSPKSSHSMTTILKTKIMPSFSKSEIKGKRSVSPKQRQQYERGTENQDKVYKRTKSATSMTYVPKSKAKAQLAIKEEKVASKVKRKAKLQVVAKDKRLKGKGIRVQVSPQSNLDNCECKPSTISTSSLTSVPKQKATKSRSKRIKSYEVGLPPTRHKRARQKPRRESYQNVEQADLEEPIELVTPKRQKRLKPTHGRIKQRRKHKHSNTQLTGILSKVSQESYLRESASQTKDLPFPRECEPFMCIPYECDPEICAEILLSRSKSRGESAITGLDRLRRKSVGNAAFSQKKSQKTSQKTSSRSRTKSRHKHSKSAEFFVRKPKYVSKEPASQIVKKSSPERQAVKITSSFNFDIEFYKDTDPSLKHDEIKDSVSGHQKKIKLKEHRRNNKDRGTEYISSRQNISSQSRSSQSFRNIQVGHRLKRCFCTIKLPPKKKQILKNVVSKRTMTSFHNKELDMEPRKKRTQTKHSGIAYVVPPATSTPHSLLPYECEPYFCTPGECNPYECAERIKQRNHGATRRFSKDTNTSSTPKISKLVSTSQSASKSTSRPINICDCHTQSSNEKCDCTVSGQKSERHDKRNTNIKGRHSPSSNVKRKVSGDKLERKAVRIGSSLTFNIEFSKTNINDQEREDTLIYDKLINRERKQEKGIKVYKPHVRHETSETKKYIKTKQTFTEPFFQRCLCTLKLLKKNKKKVETLSPWRSRNEYVMHMQNKAVTTNRAEIRYNPERSKLLYYDWEPSVCIPEECDPYNCQKLIKLHHKYSNLLSGDLRSRSTLISETSRIITSKSRETIQSFTKECPQNVKKRIDYNEINFMPNRSKQREMRVGSKSSLRKSYYKSKHNFITTEDFMNKHTRKNTQRTHNKDKLNTIGSQKFKHLDPHTSIDAESNRKEKESYVFSAIKKCFNIFNFQKKKNNARLENIDVISERIKTSYPLPNSQINEHKRTRLSKLPYKSSSHKFATNFSIPEIGDPYECYGERPEVKGLHDDCVSTDRRERKSVMSVTKSDFSGSTMARSTKSRMLKRKKKQGRIGEEERDIKGVRSFSTSRQAAHNGSIFNLNKELPKNSFVPIRDTTIENRIEKYNTVSEISTVIRKSDKGTKNKRVTLKNDLSQANDIRKEDKASNVGILLKRCFCTLGPQKTNKLKPEFRWHQPITTQFVQVEQNRQDKIKPGCKVLNQTLYEGEPLKLPEGDHLFRKNVIGNQSAKHLLSSRSFSRGPRVRSRIEVNFDKMRYLLNTQKINPFYRSFYALNVKVSKSKNMSHKNYRTFNHNERKPDERPPILCDPDDCFKRKKQLKRFKGSETTSVNSRFSGNKSQKGADKPMTFGSDVTFRAGVYKDTDPYKNPCQPALRLGSDVRFNFDFFKQPISRGFFHTGPLPNEKKKARRTQPRPIDLQACGQTESKVSGISNMIRRCFCTSTMKNATKSDINQIRDITRTVKGVGTDTSRYKSTTRLSLRERERRLKTKSVQNEDYSQQQRKISHRPIDRNNVRFCSNVNCYEFYDGRTPKRGEGDVEKQQGPLAKQDIVKDKCRCEKEVKKDKCRCEKEAKKNKCRCEKEAKKNKCRCEKEAKKNKCRCEKEAKKNKCRCEKEAKKTKCRCEKDAKKNKVNKFISKCYCTLKNIKGQNGKHLSPKPSMEMIGKGKEQIKPDDGAEEEMETIMPYSKKKFKKIHSQIKLAQGTCPNLPGDKHLSEKRSEELGKGESRKGPCPRVKNNLPCPCKGQGKAKQRKIGPVGKRKQQMSVKPVVDNTPLFEMTVNEATMKIINKTEVLNNLGLSGKESKAMKKARAAIEAGNVDAPVMEVLIDSENAQIINLDQLVKQIKDQKTLKRGKSIKGEKRTKVSEQAGRTTTSSKQTGRKGLEPASTLLSMKSVKKELRPTAKSQDGKCKCCICRGLRTNKEKTEKQFPVQSSKLGPCICGSVVCKKARDKIDLEQKSKAAVKVKTCVCGSPICGKESSKMPELLLERARKLEHKREKAKQAVIKEKLSKQARKNLAKERDKAFKKKMKLRAQEDNRKMRSIEKTENAGDIRMVAESWMDLGSFGSKVFCDIAESVFRSVRHPIDTIADVKDALKRPDRAARAIKKTVKGMGFYPTLDRIKHRFFRMPTAKVAISTMEAFPVTNYLVHMADKDPKKRMKKFKPKRKREQLDFKCSLYMSSMRKRPCLTIYRICPWFYPHCISLLTVWKQFTDVLLFILAVGVWSPCIMCMELLRGCVCCCMCQA